MANAPTELYIDAVAGDDTTGDGSIGNPWQSPAYAYSQATVTNGGTTVWCKASGVYDIATPITFDKDFAGAGAFCFRGYSSTPGDRGKAVFDGGWRNQPIFTKSWWNLKRFAMQDLIIRNWGNDWAASSGLGMIFINCEFTGGLYGFTGGTNFITAVVGCYFNDVSRAVANAHCIIGNTVENTGANYSITTVANEAAIASTAIFGTIAFNLVKLNGATNSRAFYATASVNTPLAILMNHVDGGGDGYAYTSTHSCGGILALGNTAVNVASFGSWSGWSSIEGNTSQKPAMLAGNVFDTGSGFTDEQILGFPNYVRPADFDFDLLTGNNLTASSIATFADVMEFYSSRFFPGCFQPNGSGGGGAITLNPFRSRAFGGC